MLKNINQTFRNWSNYEFSAHGYYEKDRPSVYKIHTEGYTINVSKTDNPYYGDDDVTYVAVISTESRNVDRGTGVILKESRSVLFRDINEFGELANSFGCLNNENLTSFVKNIIKEVIEES